MQIYLNIGSQELKNVESIAILQIASVNGIPRLTYGVRKGSKAAVPVHRYFFTGPPLKFTGGPLNITGAPLYLTGAPLYLPVDC